MASRHIFYDINNGNLYTSTGEYIGNNSIQVYFSNKEDITLHYITSTKESENGILDPFTWDKWTDLNGLAIGSTISFDDDYVHAVKGTLTSTVSAGDTFVIVKADISTDVLNPSDKLTFYNSDGTTTTLLYSAYTNSEDGIIFTLTEPTTVSIPANTTVRVPQALFVKITDVDSTQSSEGIFSFTFYAYSHKLLNYIDFSSVQAIGGTLEHQIMSEGNRIRTFAFPFTIVNLLDFDNAATVPSQNGDWVDKAYVQSFFTAGETYQYSVNGTDWHDSLEVGDIYYRSRLNTPNATWGDARKLLYGISIKDVQQTVASTESGEANVVTITLDNGATTDVYIYNGDTPVIGDNGNWFIGGVDTGVGAGGQNGKTPHVGENGNWFVGETDTGVSASGRDGTDGINGKDGTDGTTPHIGENKNWYIGTTDTGVVAAGKDGTTPHIGENGNWYIGTEDTRVLANAEGMFTNGVPPFTFTKDDLTDGCLIKTYAKLGLVGRNPVSVSVLSNDGVIMDGDVRVSIVWQNTGIKVDLSQFGEIPGTWKLVFGGGSAVDGDVVVVSGDGYTRVVTEQNLAVQSGYWYICKKAITLTLPKGSNEKYIRVSTDYQTDHVLVIPSNGESIDGDTEGFTLDKTSGTVEFFWTGAEWTVIEAK